MTFRELLAEGRRRLEAAGIEEAENDARLLLLDTYRIDWCSLVSVYEMKVPVNPPMPPVSACKVVPRRISHETEAGKEGTVEKNAAEKAAEDKAGKAAAEAEGDKTGKAAAEAEKTA